MEAITPATVTIRYLAGIDSTCVVVKGTTVYEIIGDPDDIGERHEYLEIKVQGMRSG